MPTVMNPDLTLSESNGFVTMTIVFIPAFSSFEKELGSLGCTYDAHYIVHGVDNGSGSGVEGRRHPQQAIPMSRTMPVFPVIQVATVARSLLQAGLPQANR